MIVLGRIKAPYGVRGWVRIHPFGDDPLSWERMPTWWLSLDAEAPLAQWQAFGLRACRLQGGDLVAAFDGVEDRTAAERLQGMYFGAPRESLPETDRDEYYWSDLIGLRVENGDGFALGVVEELIETGANQVLVVRKDGEERLLPFIGAVVKDVDLAAGRILVDWAADW